MCWKLRITVVVPAPDDPVMAMMGCLTDMVRASFQYKEINACSARLDAGHCQV
jgi:hypothetical protein